ncbi:MAG: NAD-dependent epimerase/dehydratase family protein [Niabella sp.]
MRLLITGAAGFIGSHLAEKLARAGHEVTGVDNFSNYYDPALKRQNAAEVEKRGVIIKNIDLRDAQALDGVSKNFDYIFHLAGQSGISATTGFDDYLQNNIIATQNLLNFASQNSELRLFANISTSSVYGLDATCAEDEVPKPASVYGVTKLAAEQLALAQGRQGLLNVCSLRLYSVYGPRERPEKLYNLLIDAALKGNTFPLYEGSEKHLRSFTYVGDIVNGLMAVIGREEALKNEIINIGSGLEYSTQQGIDWVEQITGKKINIQVVPPRAGDQLRTMAIIDKAEKLLNYQPSTSLEAGIREQVAWFKEHKL